MNRSFYTMTIFLWLSFFSPLFSGPKIDFLKAVVHGNRATIQELLEKEGSHFVYLRDKNGDTPLHLACRTKKPDQAEAMIKLLIKNGADINARNTYLATPLHIAIATENYAAATTLLQLPGIEPNYLNERSYTPLHEATFKRSTSFIKLLLASPAILPNVATCDGATPLHFAAMWGFYPEAKLLLTHPNTDPNAKQHAGDYVGATPLHFAALQAQPQIVALLLEKNADVSIIASQGLFKGFTPLHFAVMNPDTINVLKTVKLLLQAGANPNIPSALGKKPIDLTNVHIVRNVLNSPQPSVATEAGAAQL